MKTEDKKCVPVMNVCCAKYMQTNFDWYKNND